MSDNKINNNKVVKINFKFDEPIHEIILCQDIVIGDFIFIKKNEEIPADMIVVNSSNEDGVIFINTSSLDGEKTLKNKVFFIILECFQTFKDSEFI